MTNRHAVVVILFCLKKKKKVVTAYGVRAISSEGH